MNRCVDCANWYWTDQWEGNCRILQWERAQPSQSAVAGECPHYTLKGSMRQGPDVLKDMVSSICLVCCAGFWLFVFVMILVNEALCMCESNMIILVAEIGLCVAMVALGVDRYRNVIKVNGRRPGRCHSIPEPANNESKEDK